MSLTIALAQCMSRETIDENLSQARFYLEKAAAAQARLLVFPEYFMLPYTMDKMCYIAFAQSLDGSFVRKMRQLAKEYCIWISFGMNEAPPEDKKGRIYNTTVIVDSSGEISGHYRKTHLFDAFNWKESDYTIPGESLFSPIPTPFGTIGLGVCYDLRFPDLALHAALNGTQVMLYPSAWVRGRLKHIQWKTLLAARAIENGIFTVGCNHYSPDTYMGQSCIVDPFGNDVANGGSREELIIAHLDLEQVAEAHSLIPSLNNRRSDLY